MLNALDVQYVRVICTCDVNCECEPLGEFELRARAAFARGGLVGQGVRARAAERHFAELRGGRAAAPSRARRHLLDHVRLLLVQLGQQRLLEQVEHDAQMVRLLRAHTQYPQ